MSWRNPVAVFTLLAWAGSGFGQGKVERLNNITYATVDGIALHLDVAKPDKGEGPFPLVVCVHGGAWQAGNRGGHHRTIDLLARKGFVAATIQYRLAPRAKYPAQIEDVRAAVRFLRDKAKEWNIHPDKVAALGDSAGGHLSLLVGLMDAPTGEKVSSRVQAVVNYYGPTDFRVWKLPEVGDKLLVLGLKKNSDELLKDFLGTSDRKDPIMKTVSPVTYIDAKDPPVLTFQGTIDPLVPPEQARLLHKALDLAGVPNHLEILEGMTHGWGGATRERTDRMTLEFLEKYLK